MARTFVQCGELKQITSKHRTVFWKPYMGKTISTAIRFEFGASKKGHTIAIEFVPSKLTDDEWADFLGCCNLIVGVQSLMKNFKIQLLELAMDVRRPMSEYVFVAPALKVSNIYYSAKGTIYIGAKSGRRSFTIYDKQKQLFEKKNVHVPHALMRIESKTRRLQIGISSLGLVASPFHSLLVVSKPVLAEIQIGVTHDAVLKTFCDSTLNGMSGQDAYWEHGTEARKHIIKRLRPYALKLANSPKHWAQWIAGQQLHMEQKMG